VARVDVNIAGESWTLSAAFADLRPRGLLRQRYDDTRPADYLAAWFVHLALCAAPSAGVACATRGLSRDGEFAFSAVTPDEARTLLADALALYREGLVQPLRFFPKSAWAYVANDESAAKAQAKWSGGNRPEFGESADAAYRLALRGVAAPLDEAFFALARRVLQPLIQHLQDERLR
jgi:exodeoxyribonuclease V gamma subunit